MYQVMIKWHIADTANQKFVHTMVAFFPIQRQREKEEKYDSLVQYHIVLGLFFKSFCVVAEI